MTPEEHARRDLDDVVEAHRTETPLVAQPQQRDAALAVIVTAAIAGAAVGSLVTWALLKAFGAS